MSGGGTRVEKDSMGEMSLPASALYGASTQRAVLNFPVSGYRFPREFIRALGLIKWAAAQANHDLGFARCAPEFAHRASGRGSDRGQT
jgi:fumarate hydratase class II